MSCIKLNLIDFSGTMSGQVHGSIGDAVIAALSAEPETIGELELAVGRFIKPSEGWSEFGSLRAGADFEPYDAGIVIVDLAARIVMLDSTYSAPQRMREPSQNDTAHQIESEAEEKIFMQGDEALPKPGQARTSHRSERPQTYGICYHNGQHATDLYLPYRLPDDWLFLYSVPEYEGVCRERGAKRRAIVWRDQREILFGKQLCSFLAKELLSAPNLDAEDLFTEIHVRWLMTKRDDLDDRSPREVLLERMEFIDFDLHSRSLQWSFTSECPPSLSPTAHAYRFAGFGTHEIVIYYDLVRLLFTACLERVHEDKHLSLENEIDRLDKIKNCWLETANEEYQNKAPALIIEWERKRIPLAISGKEAMVDDDCPICQAMADDLDGPYFWHLDGSEMDDRFEFSFYKTREEWDAQQKEYEEFSRKFNAEWEAKKKVGESDALGDADAKFNTVSAGDSPF